MLASHFRDAAVPVIGRIKNDRFWLDLRTIYEREHAWLVETATEVAKML